MLRFANAMIGALVLIVAVPAHAASTWIAGQHYVQLGQIQHTTVAAGKVEVLEVFSYGCPGCNQFQPLMEKLKVSLPGNAQMAFLPASFKPDEDWVMFQRAYFTAQALGIADRTHQSIFDAVWKTGELSYLDPNTRRIKKPLPTIDDAAKCYERLTGVKADAFLAVSRSFGVDTKMKAADAQVFAMQVPGTPCIVVNGKYRVNLDSISSEGELIELVKYLVGKEMASAAAAGGR